MSRSGRLVPLGVLTLALLLPPVTAGAVEPEEPPINITADRMEYFSDKEIVIFTGNALAVRDDATLSADVMEVTLGGEGAAQEGGSVEKVVATGNVNFRQSILETGKDRFATGERGVYDAGESLITLTGQPKAWEGPNVITGKTMKFYIDEHRFVAEGDEQTPVGMTVFPKKGEDEQE
jgi:lipopolysaccharide export system protein LptA